MMKLWGIIFRIFCWTLCIFAVISVILYAHRNPTYTSAIYIIWFPILYLSSKTIPVPSYNWRKRKAFFEDNFVAFEKYGQQRTDALKTNLRIAYHSGKDNQPKDSPETTLSASLLNYVLENDLSDGEPTIRIKSRKCGKGLEVIVCCTWYQKYIYYWIPENEIAIFENFRFNKTVRIEENWFLIV